MKEHVLLWTAVHALEIDLPILSYEVLGPEAIRLNLYGGRVVEYVVRRAAPPRRAGLSGQGPLAGKGAGQGREPGAAAPPADPVSKTTPAGFEQLQGGDR